MDRPTLRSNGTSPRPYRATRIPLDRHPQKVVGKQREGGITMGIRIRLITALALLASAALTSRAQEVSAGVTGLVTDPSGAAVADASVTARDLERGTVWQTKTNAEGVYALPRIPTGRYEIRIAAPGFRTAVQPSVLLEVNQRARLDVQLELGSLTETVEVRGTAALLQTETTQVGAVIGATTSVNLPLSGRNFVALTLLVPGVTTPNMAGFSSGRRTTGGGRPYVHGNRQEANNFLLDGTDNNHATSNMVSYQPSVDAIQEFKMITNNAPAEFGNFQGAVINVTIKSGTNELHGSIFEFIRNDKLNANSWARNWQGAGKPAMRHNVFGGAVGGPIRKDKLFFFTDYEGTRRATPGAPGLITVVAAEFRRGDFSRLLSEHGIQLYNPLTLDASGRRQPFPNNQIPASLADVVARNLFSSELYPQPSNPSLRFNAYNQTSQYVNTDQGDVKIDAKLSPKDDFSARYSNSRHDVPAVNSFVLLFDEFFTAPFQAGVLNWTRTLSPTLVNELRVGFNRIGFSDGGADKGVGNLAEKLGIVRGNERQPGLMALQFSGGLATGLGRTNMTRQRLIANNTFHYADNLTIVRGRHLMKTGGQVLRQQANNFFAGNNGVTGFIRFTGQYTAGPAAGAPARQTGLAEADFFLGFPTRLGRGVDTGTWGHRKNILGFYFQDDWRASDSLTLNLGLRWEYHTPFYEVCDRQSNFEPFSGKLLLAGKDGNNRALYYGYKRDWQPRVGFAWTPPWLGRKTALRGAYTISSFMEGTGSNLRLPLNPPFNTEYEAIYEGQIRPVSTTGEGLTVLKAMDPWRNVNIRLWDPFVRPAHVQQWSFIIERELPQETVFSAGYVGQHGTHLIVPMAYFQRRLPPGGRIEPSPYLAGNPLLAGIAQISGTEANGNQRYDGLQVSVRRRWRAGLHYMVAYTWSKGMSDSSGFYGEGGQAGGQSAYWQYRYDRRAEWGPSYFDAAHALVYSWIWELPFGRRKRFGATWNPMLDMVLGQWQISGILNLHTGFPLTITALDRSGTGSRGPRADRVADGKGSREIGPGKAWLDRQAFRQPVAGTLGSSGIGVVRGPGYKAADISAQKFFRLTESKRLEFRADVFNVSNTPQFNAPDRAVQSATFGEVASAQGERQIQFGMKFYF